MVVAYQMLAMQAGMVVAYQVAVRAGMVVTIQQVYQVVFDVVACNIG